MTSSTFSALIAAALLLGACASRDVSNQPPKPSQKEDYLVVYSHVRDPRIREGDVVRFEALKEPSRDRDFAYNGKVGMGYGCIYDKRFDGGALCAELLPNSHAEPGTTYILAFEEPFVDLSDPEEGDMVGIAKASWWESYGRQMHQRMRQTRGSSREQQSD